MTALAAPAPSATDRFATVLNALCRAVAARIAGRALAGALIIRIFQRLQRINTRVQVLAAQIRAGTLRHWPPRHRRAARRPTAAASSCLPRSFAWLLPLVPYEAAGYASQLRCVLSDPEMAALIAATPRMARALRPLCHMLGLEATLLSPPVADTAGVVGDPPPGESPARAAPVRLSFPQIDDAPDDPGFAGRPGERALVPT